MSQTLYVMRHGETLFNRLRRVQGFADSPLTEHGIGQCRAAGERLRALGLSFDLHCSSTSERACDTLEHVMGALYGEVRPYERMRGLKEFNRGIFEGEPLYLMPTDREVRRTFFTDYGGEGDDEALERFRRTVTAVMRRGPERALAVSHGGVGSLFYRDVTGEDEVVPGQRGVPNCAVIAYEFDAASGAFSCVDKILPDPEA